MMYTHVLEILHQISGNSRGCLVHNVVRILPRDIDPCNREPVVVLANVLLLVQRVVVRTVCREFTYIELRSKFNCSRSLIAGKRTTSHCMPMS